MDAILYSSVVVCVILAYLGITSGTDLRYTLVWSIVSETENAVKGGEFIPIIGDLMIYLFD